MRFSVIIPAYNARDLSESIESCLSQTLRPHEIIVVDDASSEHHAESLRPRYSSECDSGFLRFINLPKNSGPSTARNVGWDAATGDFVAFLDADDTWNTNKLATVAACLDDDPSIDWLAHRYSVGPRIASRNSNCPTRISLRRLLISNLAQTSCVVLRRSITLRFDEQMRHSEDYDLWLRIVASGCGCYFSEAELTELRRPQLTGGGLSGNRWAMRRGEMLAFLHLSMLRPAWAAVLPLLLTYSLLKHFRNAIS